MAKFSFDPDGEKILIGINPTSFEYGVSENVEVVVCKEIENGYHSIRRVGFVTHGEFKPTLRGKRYSRVVEVLPEDRWREATEDELYEITTTIFERGL